MADRFGRLVFPVAPPDLSDPANKVPAIGDPMLVTLASFVASVLQAECGDAWSRFENFPDIRAAANVPDPVETFAGRNVVRSIFYANPRRVGTPFNPNDLPALFVYRLHAGVPASIETFAADVDRRTSTVVLEWVTLPSPPALFNERASFHNALSTALIPAIRESRHASWVLRADRAMTGAIHTLRTTSTSPTTLTPGPTGLNGPSIGTRLTTPRPVQFTSLSNPATYSTSPIVVTGRDVKGRLLTDDTAFTDPNGGETIETVWRFIDVLSIAYPAMLTTGGSILASYGDSPYARRGSMLNDATDAIVRMLQPGEVQPLPIPDVNDVKLYESFQIRLTVTEASDRDLTLHTDSPNGGDGEMLLPNGDTFSTDIYDT